MVKRTGYRKESCLSRIQRTSRIRDHEKQARGFGAMLTFELTKKEYAINILEKVRMIKYAEVLVGWKH